MLSISKEFIVKLIDDVVDVCVNVSICSDTLSMLFSSDVVLIPSFTVLLVAHKAGKVLCGWNWRINFIAVYFFLLQTLPAVLIVSGCVLVAILCVMFVML